jgi:hypothetical protein
MQPDSFPKKIIPHELNELNLLPTCLFVQRQSVINKLLVSDGMVLKIKFQIVPLQPVLNIIPS